MNFVGGVKSLHTFAICLYGPIYNENSLQKLSNDARLQINHAKEDIDRGHKDIDRKIAALLLKKQKIEGDKEVLEKKGNTLSKSISIKRDEICKAISDIKSAEHDVCMYVNKKEKAEIKTMVTALLTVAAGTITGLVGLVLTVLTAGIAAPAAVTGTSLAFYGAGFVATKVNNGTLEDARKSLREKTYALDECLKVLNIANTKMTDTMSKLRENKSMSERLQVEYDKLLLDSKVTTKLKVCVTECHLFMNITLGRLEVLSESSKKDFFRNNIKKITDEVINQLSTVSTVKGFSSAIRQIEEMAGEMQFLSTLINIERNNDIEISVSKRCCCLFYCCLCIPFSFVHCLFCGCRNL